VGGPEALLLRGDTTLVDQAVETVMEAGCGPVVVVLGAAANLVRTTASLDGANVLVNKAWGTGLGSSLRMGLEALDEDAAEAAVVMPVDMPGVTVEAVRRVAALPYPDALVCATYGGLRNYPMLFGRRHWAGISTLAKADVGARPYLLAHKDEIVDISCDAVADGARVDSPELVEAFGLTVPAQRTG
jgi:molybdenum cofactor cytidylyltransferase/nicotine blue oxidoreductase